MLETLVLTKNLRKLDFGGKFLFDCSVLYGASFRFCMHSNLLSFTRFQAIAWARCFSGISVTASHSTRLYAGSMYLVTVWEQMAVRTSDGCLRLRLGYSI